MGFVPAGLREGAGLPGEDELAVGDEGLAVVLDGEGALDREALVVFGLVIGLLLAVL